MLQPHAVPCPRPGRSTDLAALVAAATRREAWAWDAIVARYSPTVCGVARRHRLGHADQEEVLQMTWIRLLGAIDRIQEPEALGGWLATTARRECLRVLASGRREVPVEEAPAVEDVGAAALEEAAAAEERRRALREAIGSLRVRQRELVDLLLCDPPLSYEEVGRRLRMPVGSIGPTRLRCISRLREDPRLAAAVAA
jgi:RNA polymerase sigma factor (sigma-70 family)